MLRIKLFSRYVRNQPKANLRKSRGHFIDFSCSATTYELYEKVNRKIIITQKLRFSKKRKVN